MSGGESAVYLLLAGAVSLGGTKGQHFCAACSLPCSTPCAVSLREESRLSTLLSCELGLIAKGLSECSILGVAGKPLCD